MDKNRMPNPGDFKDANQFDLRMITQQPISEEEVIKRKAMEFDLVLMSQIQNCLVKSGDIIQSMGTNENFADFPNREEILEKAQESHAVFLEYMFSMLASVGKQLKALEPLGGKPPIQIGGK